MYAFIYNWKSLRKASIVILILIPVVILDNVTCQKANLSYYADEHDYETYKWSNFNPFPQNNKRRNGINNIPLENFSSSSRGGLGLLFLGYAAKICIYFFTYFKLICLCLFISTLFLLLCPLLPFLIPALLLILVVAAASSIAIPLIAVAAGGGGGNNDGSVTVISTGPGGGAGGPVPPQFISIPAF